MFAHRQKTCKIHSSHLIGTERSAQPASERLPRICVPGSRLTKNEGVGVATSVPSTHFFFLKAVFEGKNGAFLEKESVP